MLEKLSRITFTEEAVNQNKSYKEVSFDFEDTDNIYSIMSEFKLFLLSVGFSEELIDECIRVE